MKLTDIATGKVDAKINIKGQGASVAAIMAGLNGRTRIVTEGGKIDSGVLNVVSSDIVAALPFVDSKGDKDIRCGVVDFDIRKGQAKAKALVSRPVLSTTRSPILFNEINALAYRTF